MKINVEIVYKIIFYIIIIILSFSNILIYKYYLTIQVIYSIMILNLLIPIIHIVFFKPTIHKKDIIFILFFLYFIFFGTIIGFIHSYNLRFIIQDLIKIFFSMVMFIFYYAWIPKFNLFEEMGIFFILTISIINGYINNFNIIINYSLMLLIFLIYLFNKYKKFGKILTSMIAFLSRKQVYVLDTIFLFFLKCKYKKIIFLFLTAIFIFFILNYYKLFINIFKNISEIKMVNNMLISELGYVGDLGDRFYEIYYSIVGMEHSLLGYIIGMGNGYNYNMYNTKRLGVLLHHRNVHCSIINLYTKYGFFGIMFFLYLTYKVYKIITNKNSSFFRQGLVLTFYISSFFSFTLFNMFIVWSFITAKNKY